MCSATTLGSAPTVLNQVLSRIETDITVDRLHDLGNVCAAKAIPINQIATTDPSKLETAMVDSLLWLPSEP